MPSFFYFALLLSHVDSFKVHHKDIPLRAKAFSTRESKRFSSSALSDESELVKIFGRLADKLLLLDVPGAGTPEMKKYAARPLLNLSS